MQVLMFVGLIFFIGIMEIVPSNIEQTNQQMAKYTSNTDHTTHPDHATKYPYSPLTMNADKKSTTKYQDMLPDCV